GDDGTCLRARAAMRHADRDGLARLLLPVGDEQRVDVAVELARRIVRDVEQRRLRGRHGRIDAGQGEKRDEPTEVRPTLQDRWYHLILPPRSPRGAGKKRHMETCMYGVRRRAAR